MSLIARQARTDVRRANWRQMMTTKEVSRVD